MLEHDRSIKNYNTNSTALAQHAYKLNALNLKINNFDFKEVKILEHEQNFKKLHFELVAIDSPWQLLWKIERIDYLFIMSKFKNFFFNINLHLKYNFDISSN